MVKNAREWTIDNLRSRDLIVLECISGSHAYGLATETSDIDIKGVFVQPKADFYGLAHIEQVSDARHDENYYELGRFVELLAKNNPNILELLASPPDTVRLCHPLIKSLASDLFLSKLCEVTFGQFAYSQIKKAKGLNKKIVQPLPEKRKSVLDFCYVNSHDGTVRIITEFLQKNNWQQESCGLLNLTHMRDSYALFYAENSTYKGIMSCPDANQVCVSRIPKGEQQVGLVYFNREEYSKHCKQYNEYWQWVKNRNAVRYESTASHGKGYDAKNLMHTFRLLDTALDIAEQGKVIVKRPNRDFLLSIKAGEFEYDELVNMAEEKRTYLSNAFAQSSLPNVPDENAINALLIELRTNFYDRKN